LKLQLLQTFKLQLQLQ